MNNLINYENSLDFYENIFYSKNYTEETIKIIIDRIAGTNPALKDIFNSIFSDLPDDLKGNAAELIAGLIASPDLETRNMAGSILLTIGKPSVVPLIKLLSDDNADNRKFACDLLGNLKEKSAYPEIQNLFFRDNNFKPCP